MPDLSANLIPVTIVSGFLGAGKTTLINGILSQQQDLKVAVIVNEFGEMGIDGQLILADHDEQLVEFNNGCLCCTVREDLIKTLSSLTGRSQGLDAVLIETTGLADPAPVAATFFVSNEIRQHYRLDTFVTVADAFNLDQNLLQSHEARDQLAFADVVLLNKTDLVASEVINQLEQKIRTLNPLAEIIPAQNSQVDLDKIMRSNAFNLEVKLRVNPSWLEDTGHEHDPWVGSIALTTEHAVDMNRFMMWMNELTMGKGDDLYRTKGVFWGYGFPERVLFQSVRMLTSIQRGGEWPTGQPRRSQFVLIGRDLKQQLLEDGFRQCLVI